MRRQDREVKTVEGIQEILNECKVCRLAFYNDEYPYIIPLNYAYEFKDNQYTFYFHSALEGQKLELLKKNPHVGFEMDTSHELVEHKIACKNSYLYKSIIGNGVSSIVDDYEEKTKGLSLIMKHVAGRDEFDFPKKMVDVVCVYKVVVKELTGKVHQ